MAKKLTDYYGENCFSDTVMKKRLPKKVYWAMKQVQRGEKEMTRELADQVARAMKDWAIEKGATHYSHWFQPLTGLTAEKHDSFIHPQQDGSVIMEFSGKELIVGESDGSSFPNGGLRATFEARGYTAWDTTSPAFLKKDKTGLTLTIPTAFVAFNGEALDKKTPLLRSMEAISRSAIRLLRTLGNHHSKRVIASVGPEQEYFLVEKRLHDFRPDLKLCGRTVYGSTAAKGQEKEDHYYGAIKERVAAFMRELNQELWKLGISAKTQHNEVAPNQFELATVFDTANFVTDRNQVVMETMKRVADHHGMVCLLHEKPFAGVNGSGKHNNWSIETDDGIRLLKPGATPQDNAQFLLFLVAVIKAVDVYAPLLRASAATSGNDHRLGGNEAPPTIISMFLGEDLEMILESLASGKPIENQKGQKLELGVTTLPKFSKDNTDRNRTSPFAYTGNKFEFRMVGSSQSLSGPNVVLNSAVAQILDEFSEKLEKASDVNEMIHQIVIETYNAHKRIIFNGNGYSKEWEAEASRRGLVNLASTVEALLEYSKPYSIELFEKQGVFSKEELASRVDIYLENYSQDINIEAGVMYHLAIRSIIPAVNRYLGELSATAENLYVLSKSSGVAFSAKTQLELISAITEALDHFKKESASLDKALRVVQSINSIHQKAEGYRDIIFPLMQSVRMWGDQLEQLCDKKIWPLPSYEDLLFTL